MKQDELSAIQAPLKQKYQQNPDEAFITLRAVGDLGEGIACKVDTGRAMIEAGLHPATGGDGSQVCSGDMLLEALAACAGVTLRAVATAFGVDLQKGKVIAEGDLDFRGTLGVSKDSPVGFKEIRLKFETESDADAATLNKIISVTERYCVVLQTIKTSPPVTVSVNN